MLVYKGMERGDDDVTLHVEVFLLVNVTAFSCKVRDV